MVVCAHCNRPVALLSESRLARAALWHYITHGTVYEKGMAGTVAPGGEKLAAVQSICCQAFLCLFGSASLATVRSCRPETAA